MPEFKRYVGYNDKTRFEAMVKKMYIGAMRDGIVFENPVLSPDNSEISAISSVIDINKTTLSEQELREDMSKLENSGLINIQNINDILDADKLAYRFSKVLSLLDHLLGNKNMVRNAYIKFIGWFARYKNKKFRSILYIGSITKYELYWLYLLNILGSEVNLIMPEGDGDYMKIDPSSQLSKVIRGTVFRPIDFNFNSADCKKFENIEAMYASFTPARKERVQTLSTTMDSFCDDILERWDDRLRNRGCTVGENNIIPVYCMAYLGYTEEEIYNNLLYNLRERLAKSQKLLLFIEKGMPNPQPKETERFRGIDKNQSTAELIDDMAVLIKIEGDADRTALARFHFIEIMNNFRTDNINVLFNFGVKLIAWLYRCTGSREYIENSRNEIPVVIYYGDVTTPEIVYLQLLSRIGFDVIYISSDKSFTAITNSYNYQTRMQVFELPQSKPNTRYPDKMMKAKMATVAYNAERELDRMLYSDNNLFRSFQFSNSRSLTLKTTYDEINILWHQQAKFRAGFDTSGNLVTVPNIFAKISGLKNGDVNAYWDDVRYKLSPDSIISVKSPLMRRQQPVRPNLNSYRSFCVGTRIDIEKLQRPQFNRYSYLNDNIQHLIFYKMQEAVDSGLIINISENDIAPYVIYVGMNLGKDILKLIQNFDFTKDIPKLVIVDCVEDTFTAVECIQLVLFNLLGFDIVIYTPTGYKNLETFVSPKAYEEYTMDEFKYDLTPPRFKKPDAIPIQQDNSGFLNKLFRKGRR